MVGFFPRFHSRANCDGHRLSGHRGHLRNPRDLPVRSSKPPSTWPIPHRDTSARLIHCAGFTTIQEQAAVFEEEAARQGLQSLASW